MKSYRMVYSVPNLYNYSQTPGRLELQLEFTAKNNVAAEVKAEDVIREFNQYHRSRGVDHVLEDLFRIYKKEKKTRIFSRKTEKNSTS